MSQKQDETPAWIGWLIIGAILFALLYLGQSQKQDLSGQNGDGGNCGSNDEGC